MFHLILSSPYFGASLTFAVSCLLAELFGYWLHRLLHSDIIPFLSRGHLIHHLLIYGPGQPMRHDHYHDATHNRPSLGNIGLEWIVPSALLLATVWLLMTLLHTPPLYQTVALSTLIAWSVFTFSYLHDRMHLSDFWMAHHPLFRRWFLAARRLHDIHHHAINNLGRMHTNFGIGFFVFDRLFRTLAPRHSTFNRVGFAQACRRYGLVEREGRLVPSTDSPIYAQLSGGLK